MDNTVTVWNYNGGEYELDLQDLETVQKYEEAVKAFVKLEDGLSASEQITRTYETFVKFFDILFGDGKKIVGDRVNTRNATKAYQSLMEFIAEQKQSTVDYYNSFKQTAERYSSNRAVRREKP